MPSLSYFLPISHGTVIWQFTRREILGRYRGSMLGVGWSLLTPILMLGVYTFVFVGVFRARWPGAEHGGGLEFALQIFAGLVVFNLFAEVANRSPHLVVEQPNLVKKVVFPLQVLPWIAVLSGLFHLLLSLGVLLLSTLLLGGGLPVTALAMPVVLFPLLLLLLGMSWLLAALGVYLRDVGQIMGMAVNLAMFLSPVFYSLQSLPAGVQGWMLLNPLTLIIESLRLVLLQGGWPDWGALALYTALAAAFAAAAAWFFARTSKGFADVL